MNKGNENIEKMIKNIVEIKETKSKIYQDVQDIFEKYDELDSFQTIVYDNINGYECNIRFKCGWYFKIDMLNELQDYFGTKGFISGSEGDGKIIGFIWKD